jgi:Bifunctional DNA primase/polymerase, N-terminal
VHDYSKRDPGAFAIAAPWYYRLGYPPLPVGEDDKRALVRGYHGRSAKCITEAIVARWCRRFPSANVALRLPPGVIGIDVDAHSGKPGARSLAYLERDLGYLPETFVSTARTDGVSGIRLYRVPAGLHWPGQAGPGIDIVHSGNRYVIAAPSMHTLGRKYAWLHNEQPAALCAPDKLPELPREWELHLAQDPAAGAETDHGGSATSVRSLGALRAALDMNGRGEPCVQIAQIRDRAVRDMKAGASAHDTALNAVYAVLRDFGKGHRGANAALQDIRAAFIRAPGPLHRARSAPAEWRALFAGVRPPGSLEGLTDPCSELAAGPAVHGLTPERIAHLKRKGRK